MWWVLTDQQTLPSPEALTVIATTSEADHLFMNWAYHKPTRHPIYRRIRGKRTLCGYRWVWDTPFLAEQNTYGPTTLHTFPLANLLPGATIWFYVFSLNGPYGQQIQGPLTHVTLPILAHWVTRVYVATRHPGVYYTDNFVTDKRYPQGTPTWTKIDQGLPTPFDFRALTADPFNPSTRQFFLDKNALYRRTTGPWTPILPRSYVIAAIDCLDVPQSRFPHNALAVNINLPGWLGLTFVARHDTNGSYHHRLYFLLSTTYGSSWSIFLAEDGTLDLPYPVCLTVGHSKGTSPYPPGRVLYFMARTGYDCYCLRSYDGGATWDPFPIGPGWAQTQYPSSEGLMIVDPTDQGTCYFTGCYLPDGKYHLKASTDHGETWTFYDLAAPQPLGVKVSYLNTALTLTNIHRIGTERGRILFFKTTNGGGSWTNTPPPLPSYHLGLSTVPGAPDSLYVTDHWCDGNVRPNSIWASDDEGATFINKSGAHSDIPATGGGDSIPYTAGGVRAILPILT